MITKESQLKSSLEWIERFKTKIQELEQLKLEGKGNLDTDISIGRNRSELTKLEQEVEEYQSLIKGEFTCINPRGLEDIPATLIKLRLALDWSQKKLAEETGLDQQAISRYELNNYDGVSFNRLLEIAEAYKAHFYIEKFKVVIEGEVQTIFQLPPSYSSEKVAALEDEIENTRSLFLFKSDSNLKIA